MFSDPVAFSLFGLEFRWYAIFIMTGAFLGALLVSRLVAARGRDTSLVWDMFPIVLFSAVLGARLYYIALEWRRFAGNPGDLITLQMAGLSIHGAIIGGVLSVIVFTRIKGDSPLTWFDFIVPGLALGQAIGRWGNYANQEAFGRPTDLPWGIFIRPENRPAGYADFTHFHPTFFYESALNLVNAVLLAWIVLRIGKGTPFRTGDAFGVYLITYGIIRIPLEWLRTDSLFIGPLPAAYWASGLSIVIGLALMIAMRTIWKHDDPEASRAGTGEAGRQGSTTPAQG